MSMIERVARAICCPDGCRGDTGSGMPCDIMREDATAIWQARAAIEAMREPTDAMVDEGENHLIGSDAPRFVSGDIWTAMIDAALKSDATGDMR